MCRSRALRWAPGILRMGAEFGGAGAHGDVGAHAYPHRPAPHSVAADLPGPQGQVLRFHLGLRVDGARAAHHGCRLLVRVLQDLPPRHRSQRAVFGVPAAGHAALAVALMWVTLLGFAFILAPVCVMFSDMERLMRIMVRILFYMCPVLYGSEKVLQSKHINPVIKAFYEYNPFTTVLSMFRGAVFRNELPPVSTAVHGTIVAFALLIIGLVVFRRLEPDVLKEI